MGLDIENNKIKLAVVGSGGRVGKELLQVIMQNFNQLTPYIGVGRGSFGYENNFSNFSEMNKFLEDNKSNTIKNKPNVIIDFSAPELFNEALKFCTLNKLPMVSGTTGLSPKQFEDLKKASSITPILWSPNMSLGVAMVKKSFAAFKFLKDKDNPAFDIVMEEWHHNKKKDSPSGTALMLVERFEQEVGRKINTTQSFRAGGIFGEHHLHLVSDEEQITISHKALNRAVFAKGSIVAAQWLIDKKPDLYKIDDVLEI